MPANALEERLAAAQSRQSKKRRKFLVVAGGVAVAVVVVAVVAYLAVELERARGQLQEIGESLGEGREAKGMAVEAPRTAVDEPAAVESAPAVEPVVEVESVVEPVDEAESTVEPVAVEAAPAVEPVDEVESTVEPAAVEVAPAVEPVVEVESAAEPVDEAESTVEPVAVEVAPAVEPVDEVESAVEPVADAAADSEDSRAQVMARLAEFEAVEAQIEALNLRDWDAARHAQLANLKTRAIEQFAAGDYAAAQESVRQARELAAQAIADRARELAAARRAALDAFAAGRVSEAEAAIRRALLLDPGDAEMTALLQRVAALAEVSDWLAQAAVARAENRPAREAAALQKVLALDPARADARERLQELRARMTREQFADAIRGAQDALAAGDLPAAAQFIGAAQAIFPGHEALQPLQAQLQAARAEREFAAQLALGAQAGRRDDWATAAAHFSRARQIKPNDSDAVAGLNDAQEVIDAGREIARILAQPQRLADRRVVDSAAAYLAQVEPVVARSAKLQASRDQLAAVVAAYLAEVEVVVVSDNASDIVVRGVGQVGKTARRAIQLRPGARVFECKRRGYKSKLVPLDIPPGAAGPFEVTVICDEKI